ncbi:MAG TPA: helix-turn-helix domain-containing protein, partial [Polyangia bacterium]|nr:helix-turn-helix domain-containing protein [Polyangia bacterium]
KMGPLTSDTYVDVPLPTDARAAALTQRLPTLTDPLKLAERQEIIDALAAHNGNQTQAAKSIGMPRRTFVSKLDHYGIPRPQKKIVPRVPAREPTEEPN